MPTHETTMPDDGREFDRQLRAAEQLPRDMMLLKMENESIMAAARITPRQNDVVIKQLQSIIDAYPAAADEAIYCKPVGTVYLTECAKCKNRYELGFKEKDKPECPKCGCQNANWQRKVQKYAENLSIRAAETIRTLYGFNRLATVTDPLPDGRVRITGVFVDYASGTMTSDERIVSPNYKGRSGRMETMAEDRFMDVHVKAQKSKLRRDIILDSVPAVVKAAFRDRCEKKIQETVTEGKIETEVLPYLRKLGLTDEQVEFIVGRPISLGWTQDDLLTLRKIATALKNEEITIAELVEDMLEKPVTNQPQNTPPASAQGGTTAEDLTQPKKRRGSKKDENAADTGHKPPDGVSDSEPPPDAKSAVDSPPDPTPAKEHAPLSFGPPAAQTEPAEGSSDSLKCIGARVSDEVMQLLKDRLAEHTTKQGTATFRSEVMNITMSLDQRALLMSLALAKEGALNE